MTTVTIELPDETFAAAISNRSTMPWTITSTSATPLTSFSKKLVVIALAGFFPTLINAAAGVHLIAPSHFEVVQSYGGGAGSIFRHVVLSGSLPVMLTGLRIAASIGLTVAVSIEFAVAARGIGSVLWMSWQTMRIEDLYAGIVVIALIGITLSAAIQWSIRRVAPCQRED
jgi:ABC-type nitrate/sulfonate/bicarbonate transport system permease component